MTCGTPTAGEGGGARGRQETFVALSAVLTGIGPVPLAGTGQTKAYLAELDRILPAGLLDDMLARFDELERAPEVETGVEAAILADPRLGPVARSLILLWYRGAWTQLPTAWRASFGAADLDSSRVISGAAYRSGLQWVVAGGHASGANGQGYGAWALLPAAGALR